MLLLMLLLSWSELRFAVQTYFTASWEMLYVHDMWGAEIAMNYPGRRCGEKTFGFRQR